MRDEDLTLFETWVERQGVSRPFTALVNMGQTSRRHIADQLSVNLDHSLSQVFLHAYGDPGGVALNPFFEKAFRQVGALSEAQAEACLIIGEDGIVYNLRLGQISKKAEACLIIGEDGTGIQARSHSTWRTLSLWAENHTWREVLLSVIDEFNIPLQKQREDSTEEDLESAIFEYVADEVLNRTDSAQLGEIEEFIRQQPEFSRKLREAGFGPKGLRLVISGVFKAASKGGFGTYITAVKAAAFLNRKLGTRLAMNVVTKGLKTVLRGLNVVLWVWLACDVLSWLFGPSRRRLLPVIAQIHQHYLLEKIEE